VPQNYTACSSKMGIPDLIPVKAVAPGGVAPQKAWPLPAGRVFSPLLHQVNLYSSRLLLSEVYLFYLFIVGFSHRRIPRIICRVAARQQNCSALYGETLEFSLLRRPLLWLVSPCLAWKLERMSTARPSTRPHLSPTVLLLYPTTTNHHTAHLAFRRSNDHGAPNDTSGQPYPSPTRGHSPEQDHQPQWTQVSVQD
jgi:hypothetical protein